MRNDFNSNYLMHHGILGQKWGIRRYQNEDGTLTDAGKKRYGAESVDKINTALGAQRRLNDVDKAIAYNKKDMRKSKKQMDKLELKSSRQAIKAPSEKEDKKSKKIADKFQAAKDKNKVAQDYIKKGESETWKIMGNQAERGNSVIGTQTMRLTMSKGEAAITGLFAANGGVLGGAVVGAMISTGERSQVGYKYKVKTDGQGSVQIKKRARLEEYDRR